MDPASVQIKICGITTSADARMAAAAGADAIGLNFVGGPRKIDSDRAAAILEALPKHVEAWVLADVTAGDVPSSVHRLDIGRRVARLQMYGQVTPGTMQRLHDDGWLTVAVRYAVERRFVADTQAWLDACGSYRPGLVLLDAGGGRQLGGTGQRLDWPMIAADAKAAL